MSSKRPLRQTNYVPPSQHFDSKDLSILKNQRADAFPIVNIKREMLELEFNRNALKYKSRSTCYKQTISSGAFITKLLPSPKQVPPYGASSASHLTIVSECANSVWFMLNGWSIRQNVGFWNITLILLKTWRRPGLEPLQKTTFGKSFIHRLQVCMFIKWLTGAGHGHGYIIQNHY